MKQRLIVRYLENPTVPSSIIFTNKHYNIYTHEHGLNSINVEVNLQFGESIKNNTEPNVKIDELIKNEKAPPLFTDGSKSPNSRSVSSACCSLETKIKILRSIARHASIYTAE